MSDENDKKPEPPTKTNIAPGGLLTRDTDHASRPGFRSKPNDKSKAQKSKKKK